MANSSNVIQSNKMPDSVNSYDLNPWEGELYQEVLHNSNQDEIDAVSDAFNADKLLEYYVQNGLMKELYQNTGFFVPQAELADDAVNYGQEKTTVGVDNGLGLFNQIKIYNFETHDDLANPPTYNTIKSGEYARLVELNDDGTVTDAQKILMSTKLSYVVGGLLATMGKNQHAGAAETITQMFLKAQGNADEVLRYLTPDGKSIYNLINEDGLDTSKVNMYFPEGFINLFGQWYLANKSLFEGGASEKIEPVINMTYNTSNPLPVRALNSSDFKFNFPSGASASVQSYYNTLQGIYGDMDALAGSLYTYTLNSFETVFNAKATMVSRYGTFDAANFYQEITFYFDTYNGHARLWCNITFIPVYKNKTGDSGLQFTNYDDTNINTGDVWPSNASNIIAGEMSPYGNLYWDTLNASSRANESGDIGVNSFTYNMGNPDMRIFGITPQAGRWYWDNLVSLGGGNADFDTDPNATEFDENSGLLSSFINSLSGNSSYKPKGNDNFPNYAMLNPLVGNQNINGSTTVSSQSGQLAALPTYADMTNTNYPWNSTPTTSINYVNQQQQQIQDLINNYIANHPELNADNSEIDLSNPSSGDSTGENATNTEETIIVDTAVPSTICEAYWLDSTDLGTISQRIWSESFYEDFIKRGAGCAIQEAVISLQTIYSFCALNAQNTTTIPMYIGGVNANLASPRLTMRYSETTLCDIQIKPLFQSYLDYTSVTYKLYLPAVGYVDLSAQDLLDGINSLGKTLRVKFVIDWFTGMGAYNLYSKTAAGQSVFLGSYQANFGSSIPLTQRNFQSAVQGCFQAVNGAAIGAATSGAAGAMLGAMPGLLNVAQNTFGSITQKGNFTANGAALGPKKIYLLRSYPNTAYTQDIRKFKNYPDYRACYIGNLKGSGLCSFETNNLKGSFSCTSEELEMIKSQLSEGVIL